MALAFHSQFVSPNQGSGSLLPRLVRDHMMADSLHRKSFHVGGWCPHSLADALFKRRKLSPPLTSPHGKNLGALQSVSLNIILGRSLWEGCHGQPAAHHIAWGLGAVATA